VAPPPSAPPPSAPTAPGPFARVPILPPRLEVSRPDEPAEREADRVAEVVMRRIAAGGAGGDPALTLPPIRPRLQRAADAESGDGAPAGLIVDDEAQTLSAGQMRKRAFLDALRTEVCAAADRALADTGQSTKGCPYVEKWLAHYADKPAEHVERAVRKYAPAARGVSDARQYIPAVAARVTEATTTWARTGQIPADLPPELQSELPGAEGGAMGALSALGSALGGFFSSLGRAIGSLFAKARDGGAAGGVDRAAASARLGTGRPLEPPVRAKMERAFGADFSRVRVHADGSAAEASRAFHARAFTLGADVAFAAGEYQPGTPVGDALLAHELAHVVQQSQQSGAPARAPIELEPSPALEEDADLAAAAAVAELHELDTPTDDDARRSPRLRSSLRIAGRCAGSPQKTTTATSAPAKTTQQPDDWDFTPADYGKLKASGGSLRFDSDSAWFPPEFQQNLVTTLDALLDPKRAQPATLGVNTRDFYHGHIGVKEPASDKIKQLRSASDGKEESEFKKALGESFHDVTEENLPAFRIAVTNAEQAASALLREAAKQPDVVVIYHTFETNKPDDMPSKSPRRNFRTRLGGKTEPYTQPPEFWMGDYFPIYQFSFLVDQNGVVHVRPSSFRELSTVTGKPERGAD
jgi:hypothetical protein